METLLEVRGMTAGYEGVPAVRDVTLRVGAGQVVALLGPNGAGKSTTLLACSGLIPTLQGSITYLGQPVKTRAPHRLARQGLAHVPEDRALFPSLTVAQHLCLTRSTRTNSQRFFPELERLMGRPVGLLSGGEQQMVALGRALDTGPRLLVVDEMSLGLAPIIIDRLLPVLREAADQLGCGVLLVEQHVNRALDISDHAYVLAHGKLVLEGSASRLRADPDLLRSSYLGEPGIARAARVEEGPDEE
jgi:branched-chain amino acid transport system ATP-binding protein